MGSQRPSRSRPYPEDSIGTRKPKKTRRLSIQSTQLRDVSERLGRLAVARYKQAGDFRIRQEEQLRRALQTAGRALKWDAVAAFKTRPTEEISVDVKRLTQAGIRAIERDLDQEIADKKQEVRQLRRTVSTLEKLAEAEVDVFPTEVAYSYTASQQKGVYVTKLKEVIIDDPGVAETEAKRLEKRIDRLGRLRDGMVESLQRRRRTVEEATSAVQDFVRGTKPVLQDVLATLQ